MNQREERAVIWAAVAAILLGVLGLAAVLMLRQPGPFPRPFVMPMQTTTTTTTATLDLGTLPRGYPG